MGNIFPSSAQACGPALCNHMQWHLRLVLCVWQRGRLHSFCPNYIFHFLHKSTLCVHRCFKPRPILSKAPSCPIQSENYTFLSSRKSRNRQQYLLLLYWHNLISNAPLFSPFSIQLGAVSKLRWRRASHQSSILYFLAHTRSDSGLNQTRNSRKDREIVGYS